MVAHFEGTIVVCGPNAYIPVYVSTLNCVGLLAIYQYMLVHCIVWVYWLYTSICWYTVLCGSISYIPVNVGTLQWVSTCYTPVYVGILQCVGLLTIYQYMLVHCSGCLLAIHLYMLVHCSMWVYWLYTSICWYTAVGRFTRYIPVYVGTLQCVGLLAIYLYMLVHCIVWVY